MMEKTKVTHASIDAYIATFPESTQAVLRSLRETIRAAAPEAVEKISYNIPAFALNGKVIYFAGWKSHISMYPAADMADAFKGELTGYEIAKGTIKFPFSKPLPLDLIGRMVAFRLVEHNEAHA
jgi:uncharacterized protein YdhG (YjbR/CyaY superfamily)